MPKLSLVSVTLVLHITLCLTIRVPVDWNNESEVKFNEPLLNNNANEETRKYVPNQYFEYTAKKPQFAIDVAAAHSVKSPEKYYTSYPIRPYTGVNKPELGKHHMLDPEKDSFYPYQRYVSTNKDVSYVTPGSTSYDIYHPYKAEEPALQAIYKDPVLEKIRNDLRDSKNRLQKYEHDAGQSDISKDEYLENPQKTDYKYSAEKNKPSQFEIHKPMRRPVYYRPPSRYSYRENMLNKKLRHPWNQNYVKVTPMHYRPIKKHLHNLRQQHAVKFDDEQNEYPQLPIKESYVEKPDGYDIYENGRDKFLRLRDNVDESINKAVLENRPLTSENLEFKSNGDDYKLNNHDSREDEFVPIKNYAQVRKTETTKHLPRQEAFRDAESLDEIKNAPRLREAVKSTKAQIVYSEEGYEDSAYDHAGEQKHASDIEGHGGYLKESELSGGKYKTPSVSAKFKDTGGSVHRDKVIHGEKWKNDDQDNEDEIDSEDYSENEEENSDESDINADNTNVETISESEVLGEKSKDWLKQNTETSRSKKQEISDNGSSIIDINKKHVLNKREFKVPQINYNSTYLSGDQITQLKISQEKENHTDHDKSKYPYYFEKSDKINNDSPLRYAENLKLIPKKTLGGTEFYDSKKEISCPTIEEDVDPIPEKLKKGENLDDNDSDGSKDAEFAQLKNKQRLDGLGDKIDCLKIKYFGENPLDSPFFKEDIIASPKPITKPDISLFHRNKKEQMVPSTQLKNKNLNYDTDMFAFLEKIRNKKKTKQQDQMITETLPANRHLISNLKQEETPDKHGSFNLLNKIKQNNTHALFGLSKNFESINSNQSLISRKKRATPFMYEPYKIIKESQVLDSKKTTTTNNISPLIKQLQSSRVVDRVSANQNKDQIVKRNTNTKSYKDIGKVERQNQHKTESDDFQETDFIDISIDKRRGEPKYELQHRNHKNHYTPVNIIKSISLDEYRDQTGITNYGTTKLNLLSRNESILPTSKPNFHILKYLPFSDDTQNSAASNAVNNIILTSTIKPIILTDDDEESEDEEEYDDYESDKKAQQEKEIISSTTTTTEKPLRKRKPVRILTTTKPALHIDEDNNNNMPVLRLKTRFRSTDTVPEVNKNNKIKSKVNSDYTESLPNITPKQREKKKKVSQSTIVTDTKAYGEDDDDMQKEDIDALIGVKHDIDDYLPEYERQPNRKGNNKPDHEEKVEEEEYDRDDEDRDDDAEEDEEQDEDEDEDDEYIVENTDEDNTSSRIRLTTPEPTKRTLPKTTETTISTTEITMNRDDIKPTILKKKIEVHRELPVSKSSPNVTHFKEDIKEIEIIKTIPPKTRQKTRKNSEALDLYKDENLAKDVNKLGGVEIFKEDLDIASGPKHGGNYRNIEAKYLNKEPFKKDVETSQSETKKQIESKGSTNSPRLVNGRQGSNVRNRGRNAELKEFIDTTEAPVRYLHGGNLKLLPKRGRNKNEKIIELNDNNEGTLQLHGGNLKARRGKNNERNYRGENYENSQVVQDPEDYEENSDQTEKKTKHDPDKSGNAAVLLSSYARAVPILTTTPPFILDPSKRRYYYVDV